MTQLSAFICAIVGLDVWIGGDVSVIRITGDLPGCENGRLTNLLHEE